MEIVGIEMEKLHDEPRKGDVRDSLADERRKNGFKRITSLA